MRYFSVSVQIILLTTFFGRIIATPIANVWLSPVGSLTPLRQYHIQDGSGGYHYSFTGPHHAKSESSLNGITQGGKSSKLFLSELNSFIQIKSVITNEISRYIILFTFIHFHFVIIVIYFHREKVRCFRIKFLRSFSPLYILLHLHFILPLSFHFYQFQFPSYSSNRGIFFPLFIPAKKFSTDCSF